MSEAESSSLSKSLASDVELIQEFLTFGVGDSLYSFPLRSVHEILRPLPITHVPSAPEFVLGVITVRGRIITVVDPAKRLRLASSNEPRRILLVNNGEEIIGVVVDTVAQVHRLLPSQIEYTSDIGGDLSELIVGVARPGVEGNTQDDVIVLLDPAPLLRVV